jgi:hypothetical protein
MDNTNIQIYWNGPTVYVQTDIASIILFVDSISFVCGDTLGVKFCGKRTFAIWDSSSG